MSHFPDYIFGAHWALPSLVFGSALTVAAVKKPKSIPVFCALALGAVVPLIPLISFPGLTGPDRYLFLFWFIASLTCVLALQTTTTTVDTNRKYFHYSAGIALALLMGAFTVSHTTNIQQANRTNYREFDAQGRFYFDANQQVGFIPTAMLLHGYWYVTSLCDIKKRLGLSCPIALIKGVPTVEPVDRLFTYDPAEGAMSEISVGVSKVFARIVSIDTSRPLNAAITIEEGWGRWRLGPYETGQYYFASPKIGRYPITKNGVLKTPLTSLSFYIQFESPEGWSTSSPLLTAEVGQPVAWKRTTEK